MWRVSIEDRVRGARRSLTPLLAVLVLLLLGGLAFGLVRFNDTGRSDADRSFRAQAHIAATLVQSIFNAQELAAQGDAVQRFAARALDPRSLTAYAQQGEFTDAYIASANGALLASFPARPGAVAQRLAPLPGYVRTGLSGRFTISSVVRSPTTGRPSVDIVIPFTTPSGPRALVTTYPISVVNAFLSPYLARVPQIAHGQAFVLDSSGGIVQSTVTGRAGAPTSEPAFADQLGRHVQGAYQSGATTTSYASAPIADTSWRMVITAPQSSLYAAFGGLRGSVPWLVFGLLAFASAAGLGLLRRADLHGAELAEAHRSMRKLLEDVRDGEQRYRSLVEQLPAIVYRAEFGEAGAWRYVGPQIESILGFTPEQWKGDAGLWISCVHPEDRADALAHEEHTRLTGARLSCQYRMVAKDGRVIWIRDEAMILKEADGSLLQGVMYDITDQKQAEEAIRNQSEILERTVAERTRELDEARVETLQRLAFAAEYRDDETHRHTERIGRIAALLAKEVGLPPDQVTLIRRAAPLHDVGKLGISDAILLKPGKLDAREREIMQGHATIGARILTGSHSKVLQLGEEIALTHHERWDGYGYPRGLAREEIPISGRLVAVADVFDALTHTRPYKEAWPVAEAVAEIVRLSNQHFDPTIVAAFLTLDHALGLQLAPQQADA
jgi:PAS domain S-box-containing protein